MKRIIALLATAALLASFFAFLPSASAQTVTFNVEVTSLTCDVNVQTDGSVTLKYTIEMHYIDGTEAKITEYDVGMPKDGFTITSCTDGYGNAIEHARASAAYCACGETVHPDIPLGQTGTLILEASVPDIVYQDSANADQVAIEFIPAWWEGFQVKYLTLRMFVPCSTDTSVYVSTDSGFNQPTSKSLSGATTVISWTKSNLASGEMYKVGVFFPKSCVTHYADVKPDNPNVNPNDNNNNENTNTGFPFGTESCGSYMCCFGIFAAIMGISIISTLFNKLFGFRRRSYTSPYYSSFGGYGNRGYSGFSNSGCVSTGCVSSGGGFHGGGGHSCACACAGGGIR